MASEVEEDFTESRYRRIIRAAKDIYAFEGYGATTTEPHVLWRHDVDLSVHRALQIARIEADEGVKSTYFFLLGGQFYNLFEPAITARARSILELGHELGVHLETSVQAGEGSAGIVKNLTRERLVLEELLEAPAHSFSFHNPGFGNDALSIDDDEVGGLINTYGRNLRERYRYVSDSNGYWRHESLASVLSSGEPRLHVLTHPGWWQRDALQPRERVRRCLDGRAEAVLREYDETLAKARRQNR